MHLVILKSTGTGIARALAQFIRSIVSYHSKYDEALKILDSKGLPDFGATFDASELLGQQLFEQTPMSVGCHDCHATASQIGNLPRNIGLDLVTVDEGAGQGKFKVASLRNVEVRGRFMHDGRFETLEEVVEFFNSGVQDNVDLDPLLREGGDPNGDVLRLNLTEVEKTALVDFMNTLTDHRLLQDPKFSNPFEEPAILVGDLNGDGLINALDVAPFIDVLINGPYRF